VIKLAHIINPVNAPDGSELQRIQPLTFESIRQAKAFAPELQVKLFAVGYPEDHAVTPDYFRMLPDLDRSVLDFGTFTKEKKLPLIGDILHRLHDCTDSEWLIYTNADIGLMPQFYSAVAAMIAQGHDAILITRRRVSGHYESIAQLPEIYSQIGGYHPGYDTFVFHRSLLDRFILDHICIGVPFIEVSLLHNFIAHARNLRHADELHLTFHIGMEVMPPIDPEYYKYNRAIYETKILPELRPYLDIAKFPHASLSFPRRMMRWILNPCFSTALVLELEGKSFRRKIKILIDEVRWKLLSSDGMA